MYFLLWQALCFYMPKWVQVPIYEISCFNFIIFQRFVWKYFENRSMITMCKNFKDKEEQIDRAKDTDEIAKEKNDNKHKENIEEIAQKLKGKSQMWDVADYIIKLLLAMITPSLAVRYFPPFINLTMF